MSDETPMRERAEDGLRWCEDWRAGQFTPAPTPDGWTVEMHGLVGDYEDLARAYLALAASRPGLVADDGLHGLASVALHAAIELFETEPLTAALHAGFAKSCLARLSILSGSAWLSCVGTSRWPDSCGRSPTSPTRTTGATAARSRCVPIAPWARRASVPNSDSAATTESQEEK